MKPLQLDTIIPCSTTRTTARLHPSSSRLRGRHPRLLLLQDGIDDDENEAPLYAQRCDPITLTEWLEIEGAPAMPSSGSNYL